MAEYTENFNLKKPGQNDFYSIEDFNDNTDIIDAELKKLNDAIKDLDADGITLPDGKTISEKFEEITEEVGNIQELNTDEKANIVAAINEIYQVLLTHQQNTNQEIGQVASDLAAHKADYATQDTLGHIKLSDIPSTVDDIGAFGPSNYGNIVSSTVDLTLDLSHANTVLVYGTTSPRIITVPNNSSVPFPIGTQITVIRDSTGTVTFVPASGVTLNSKDNKRSIDGRYASATLIKTDTNKWVLIGALV